MHEEAGGVGETLQKLSMK